MTQKFNLFFVPKTEDRLMLSELRRNVCKQVYSTQALQYPVHMSLISSGFETKDYEAFEYELRNFSKKTKAIKLVCNKKTSVLPNRFWTGIHVPSSSELIKLQEELQNIRNNHALVKEKHPMHPPHITLAFPAKVDDVKESKNPVNKMYLDRVTIVIKEKNSKKYRIYKHIRLG